jgi:glycosyltransferase involved in cell wall biosynthesis
LKVTFFHRKARPDENFSIEAYFSDIRQYLPQDVRWKISVSRYYSNGFFPRLYNMIEAALRQEGINHITGDVHFLSLFLHKKRTILTIHDCGFMLHPSPLARFVLGLFWLKLPVWRSQVVTAVSEATKEEIIKYTGCPPEKIIVIPTTIKNSYQPLPKAFNSLCPEILLIGTAPNKNLLRVIEAVKDVPCTLSIVGKLTEAQKQLLENTGLPYQAAYSISDRAMMEKYHQCDMLVFASTLEGFGMPILEAQWVERPVVTSNCSSMPEVAGEGACLVDPFDVQCIREGVLKVINDSVYRDQLIQKGRENRLRYQSQKVALQYYQLYQDISSDY